MIVDEIFIPETSETPQNRSTSLVPDRSSLWAWTVITVISYALGVAGAIALLRTELATDTAVVPPSAETAISEGEKPTRSI